MLYANVVWHYWSNHIYLGNKTMHKTQKRKKEEIDAWYMLDFKRKNNLYSTYSAFGSLHK